MLEQIDGDWRLNMKKSEENKTTKVEISGKAKMVIQQLLQQKAILEANLNMYIQGYADSHNLEGTWNVDTDNWVITKVVEPETTVEG